MAVVTGSLFAQVYMWNQLITSNDFALGLEGETRSTAVLLHGANCQSAQAVMISLNRDLDIP